MTVKSRNIKGLSREKPSTTQQDRRADSGPRRIDDEQALALVAPPSDAEFRACGYTGEAAKYPLSDRAFLWLCRWNGISPELAPRTWRYAPNAFVQASLDRKAAFAQSDE